MNTELLAVVFGRAADLRQAAWRQKACGPRAQPTQPGVFGIGGRQQTHPAWRAKARQSLDCRLGTRHRQR
jgi:hypothetical protein